MLTVDIDATRKEAGLYRVTPHGSIDAKTAPEFEAAIQPLLVPDTKAILLDLHDVGYISSAGLGVLFLMRKYLVARGSDLAYCRIPPQIEKLFQVVSALPKQSVFATVEEADRYFYAIMDAELARRKEKAPPA